jgi:O-antigen/teichoic acid export membrane protein
MASLAFGILVFSVSIVLSPYFSGLGKPKHNTISAAIGLVFTAVCGWILIPRMGIAGAGITASLSYSATTLYQWILFLVSTRFSAKDFLLRKSEVQMALEETGKFLGITRKTTGR